MWKDIPGYEGIYIINEYGIIINTQTGHKKTWRISRQGYPCTDLYKNTERKTVFIHRLVAMAFIPNPNNYPVVMHKDNNKLNPYVNNLKWGTYSENTIQAYKEGTVKTPSGPGIYEIFDNDYCYRVRGYSGAIDAIEYGINSTVTNLLRYSTKIKQGPFEGGQIRKAEKMKPFMVNIDRRSTISS